VFERAHGPPRLEIRGDIARWRARLQVAAAPGNGRVREAGQAATP
jgi:hypothetical protein